MLAYSFHCKRVHDRAADLTRNRSSTCQTTRFWKRIKSWLHWTNLLFGMQSTYDLLCSLSVYCFFFIQCFDFRTSKSVLLDFRCIGTLRDARACFSTSLLRNFLFASAFLSYKYAHLVFTSSSTTPRVSDSVTCLSKIKSRLFKQLKMKDILSV